MKGFSIFLILALIAVNTFAGTVLFTQTDSSVEASEGLSINTWVQKPVVFQYGVITVPKQLWLVGLHGIAYKQLTYLYPTYKVFPIRSCSYTVYGPSRIYTYQLTNTLGQLLKLYSSVQNNQQATGQRTQQTVTEEAKALLTAKQANKIEQITDLNSGFTVIKLSRAYEIPRVAVAIKYITRTYWNQIRSAPLVRCLQRWEKGTYNFRLFFNGIPNWFQYTHLGEYISSVDEIEEKPSNLRVNVETKVNLISETVSVKEQYLPRQQPIFTVKGTNTYQVYTLTAFKSHPGYPILVERLNDHFGRFEEKWISKIQYRIDSDIHYFQIQVRFVPFLIDIDLEAHYYGNTRKAALLQIDERVFDSKSQKTYLDNWSEITNFNSYKAFREANQYVLSQFTYLRFYKVKAAYSALHKNGRYVRLVYESENNFFTPNGQNQFNILVYICDGKFYIDREDFKATSTAASPQNDWVSLFVKVSNIVSHSSYQKIARFFTTNHWAFWYAHRVEDIRINNDIHVIKFKNLSPAAPAEEQERQCVLRITGNQVKLLNHFQWNRVQEKTIHYTKAINYITKRYINSVPILINSKITPYGRHFELSFLDQQKSFTNAYLRYVDAEDLITEDQWQGIAYFIDFEEVSLPQNPEEKLTRWILDNQNDVITVVDVKTSSRNAYQCAVLTATQRWNFNINWFNGQWRVISKQLVNDGYYFVTGYPSVHVASCTGYLARLYPTSFIPGWLYGSIEVKNIGYFVYTRVIYRLGSYSYQAIVRTTYGVENSHSLISWDKVKIIREKQDYGYGVVYDWNYGLSSTYFFDYVYPVVQTQVQVTVEKVEVVVIEKNDLLCAFWDNGKCIACYGDYYADTFGRCIRVEDPCQYWEVSGICSKCSYGWTVNSRGKCVTDVFLGRF